MADKLIFPIGFDLQAAVDSASKEWDSKYAKRLEDLIAKRPVNVKLTFDTAKLDSLDAVKKRLAELKIEPITPETKTAIKELARELNQLARAMEAVSKYTISRGMASPDAVRAARIAEIDARRNVALERQRKLQADVRIKEERLALAREKAARAAERSASATRNANREYQSQDGYVSRLIKRLAVYAGFQQITNFLTSVREVTAEFELQRVSLGAIIQDQTRANALFSEIKSFALKSPVSILDLTKYTKQLAAYKIGVDELFETTKKLTDVSVGLGVSMDRVVLAYGQTRATGYLRASEIRQFTEMGVPIVEELASKLSKMNGELVTAAQVMDMVSKRAISFELVKDVFDDMTSAGGMFYNMQEKQGNTLFGMWAKLGDAASVMYDEIGNTDSVNSAMKGTIQLLTALMKNWRDVRNYSVAALGSFAIIKTISSVKVALKTLSDARVAAEAKAIAAKEAYIQAQLQEMRVTASGTAAQLANARAKTAAAAATLKAAEAEVAAANATTLWSKALGKLKAAFLANWWMVAIAAVAAIGTAIYNAHEKAGRLKNTLKEIADESGVEQMKSVRNFESLANVAVKAADGSKKQKEALDELIRTYKDIIPQERLTIENLREMKGNYDSLTQSIKDYVAEQMKQKQINAVLETTGKKIIDSTHEFQDVMERIWSPEQIARFMFAYEQIIRDNPTIDYYKAAQEAAENIGVSLNDIYSKTIAVSTKAKGALIRYNIALREQVTQINALDSAWNNNYIALGRYGDEYEKLANKIKDNPIELGGNKDFDEEKTPYFYGQQQQNLEIAEAIVPTLKKIMADAKVKWDDGWADIVGTIDKAQPQLISSIDFKAIRGVFDKLTPEQEKAVNKLQEIYMNIGIPDEVVRYNRKVAIDLANSMNDSLSKMGDGSRTALDNVTKYFMQSGTSVNDYAKTLDDALKDLKARIAELEAVGILMSPQARKELEDLKTAAEYVERLRALISSAVTSDTTRTPSDNRLSQLNEIEQTLTKINQKYEELLKKEGQTKALSDIQKIYGDTLAYINKLGDKFGLAFEMPTDFKTLQDYRKAIQKVIETLKMKGYEKAALELQTKIDTGDIDQLSKQIEQKLKDLSDRISRTKTAQDFYERILNTTGDYDLAANVSMSIYGDTGAELQQQMAEQIREMFAGYDVEVPVSVITDNNNVDYLALEKYVKEMQDKLGGIDSNTYKELLKIAQEGQRNLAKTYEGYLKDLEKARSYSDKRIELARYTANKIAEIEASTLAQSEKERLTAGYKEREDKEAANLEYEAFKDMPMYVQMFDDLDNASTIMLRNMQSMLQGLKGKWGETLEPTQLKEMQSRLNAINKQLAKRNPFKAIGEGIGKIRALNKEYGGLKNVEKELTTATKQLLDNKITLNTALQAQTAAQKEYDKIVAESGADSEAAQNAKSRLDSATALVNQMRENVNLTEKEAKILQDIIDKFKEANDEIDDGFQGISTYVSKCKEAQDAIKGAVEAWGNLGDDEMWNTIFEGLDKMATSAEQGGEAVAAYFQGDYFTMATKGISAVANLVAGIGTLFYGSKVAKANKEIKRQQELLEQLEYTYSRLEKVADKAFGRNYINNYNQQLENLQAQQTAYLKQAEAERSKGKKADKDKIKEYENAARETADAIKELQDDLSAHFTGKSRTDAARQMAQSWVEARSSLSDTFAAIKSDYAEMIKNMIVEGAAARVIENALTPMWNQMDKMLADNNIEGAIDSLVNGMDDALNAANNGMEVLWQALEARGYDMKQLIGDTDSSYTGIKREVAGATSEEMNANTAALNTQNYYLSQVSGMAVNLAAIRQMMENGNTSSLPSASAAGWTDWQQQAMDSYLAIQRNTADTVVECRRAAVAAESAVAELRRVIKPRSTPSTHSLHVTID